MHGSRASEVWKVLALSGICLVLIGLGAMGFDFVTRGEVSFISDHYEVFLLAIVAGAALLLISLIGLAVVLGKTGRSRIAFFTLSLSIAVILIGYAIGGTNVHGPFYLFLLPMAPLLIVGIIVAIMAANSREA
jgi:uncharacterized membrane protein